MFIDESGQDHHDSPYEVLAAAAISDSQLWNLITAVHKAEVELFGRRVTDGNRELKAKKLLKRKTFRHAEQAEPIPPAERTALAKAALDQGDSVHGHQLTALAQAKIEFCKTVLELCAAHEVYFFASIVEPRAPRPSGREILRKDYAYLFERFYYFLEKGPDTERGLVVFDELEKSQAHILVQQMGAYFKDTYKGRLRSSRIIPEPFFVHSDLTTGIQIADIVAYVVSWGVRFGRMTAPKRVELEPFAQGILSRRFKAVIDHEGWEDGFSVWSFQYIDDLRPRAEQQEEEQK